MSQLADAPGADGGGDAEPAAGAAAAAAAAASWWPDLRALAADPHVRGWCTALALLLPLLWALNRAAARRLAKQARRVAARAASSRAAFVPCRVVACTL